MILASHVIISAYGFWLPNDPRGSWSDFVGAWELRRFGAATKTEERRSLARDKHDVVLRFISKRALKHPFVKFNGLQARAIGRGFGNYVDKAGIEIWACSILPEHVHLVIGRHRLDVEQIVNQLKGYATRQLVAENLHPFPDHRGCWGRGLWKVFVDNPGHLQAAIKYVEKNPLKEGLRRQSWGFVRPCAV
jgi:REP element-mobilizing transposase RayT